MLVLLVMNALTFSRIRKKVAAAGKPKRLAFSPLVPRNGAERLLCAILSLNAGLSEELFFRLALPLVLVLVLGSALLAFMIATIVFGFMHFYQGFGGVIATTVVGAMMALIYIATGNIWIVVALHAIIDLNSFLLMPYLMQRQLMRAAAI